VVTTVVPSEALRPSVLPTERLLPNGVMRPDLRAHLRRIPDGRNAVTVLMVWAWTVVIVGVAAWWSSPIGWLMAFVLMGPMHARFAILMHEAAHKLLFTDKRINDWVGTWLVAYPAYVPVQAYRRGHFAHHKEEFGPDEPDLALYQGYPITVASLRRKLLRDAAGISGYKNLVPLVKAVKGRNQVALSIVAVQALMWLGSWALTGRWWAYWLCWFGPWMTQWRVINRLRSIAEHGGMQRSSDRRATTHVVRQSLLARFWMVPFHTGWHLAHHVDMGVPWRNLPQFHQELVAAGYVVPGIEHRSYRALWRELASRPG
jgi:fatty acid desaturase